MTWLATTVIQGNIWPYEVFLLIDTGAMVNVNHIKQARYCLQVSICLIYIELKKAHSATRSSLSPMEWFKSKTAENLICHYWNMILCLKIDFLLGSFFPFVNRIFTCMYCVSRIWFIAMDHYHYARWLSVHLFDLVNLHLNCPDVYNAFSNKKFSFDKTRRYFSAMAPDISYTNIITFA